MQAFVSVVVLVFALSASSPAQTARHPFSFDDMVALHSASAVAVSPDGNSVLYRVSFGAAKGKTNEEWYLVPTAGGESRHLTIPEQFTALGFTSDGKALYGMLEMSKRMQLATLPLAMPDTPAAAAATPVPLTALARGISSALISPDGKRYAILADPRLPDPLEEVHKVIENEPSAIYVVNADGSNGAWWCSNLRDVAHDGIAWSSDGGSLAALSQTPKIGFHYVHTDIDICSASGARHIASTENASSNIGWIDGGKQLVFLSTTTPVLTPDHVWTVPASGGTPQDRTPKLAASAVHLYVDHKGNAWVNVTRGVRGEIDLFKDNTLETALKWMDGSINEGMVTPQVAAAPDVRVVTVEDPQHASNVAIADSNTLHKITNEGDDQLAKVKLGEARVVHWKSAEGVNLEGVVTFPADYQPGKQYPFMVLPHGGPEGNDSLRFDELAKIIAGMGYVILQPEYRGSTGYGSEFLAAIYQHFGDRAYRDVDSATDFAIAQGWADPKRLTIFGWSAGGFMTSWTVTQTNRYKAAIEGAGITDWLSFIWTSDVQQFDYDARWPDKDPQAFLAFSAVMHSENVTTPLLILHGAADERVPTYQGRELFEVLGARGKTTRMVTYEGSPHFPTLWEQRQDVVREIAAWLARYNP